MSEITTLYLHGIGNDQLRPAEARILERHRRMGIHVVAATIDWESPESFPALFDRITDQAVDLLAHMAPHDMLVLEGSSAGGSLAINVLSQLDDPRLHVITHSSRLNKGRLGCWDPRSLERSAHLDTDRASPSFYESVVYCGEAILKLTESDKSRVITTKQIADEVVPIPTMTLPGVRSVTVPVVGHSAGIGIGMLKFPKLVGQFN